MKASNVEPPVVASPLIVALDFPHADGALRLADLLDPAKCRVKVGKELFTREGPAILQSLHDRGFEVFLDLKFHDIPTTVAKACAVAADMGVWMLNVHAAGGVRMMESAREAVDLSGADTMLIAVTVLTSMDADDLKAVGINNTPLQQVACLAELARQAGLNGVVCSAQEAELLRQQQAGDFVLVTPGIRLEATLDADDQRRVLTPTEAMSAGASYLVIGRPITKAHNPAKVIDEILLSLAGSTH